MINTSLLHAYSPCIQSVAEENGRRHRWCFSSASQHVLVVVCCRICIILCYAALGLERSALAMRCFALAIALAVLAVDAADPCSDQYLCRNKYAPCEGIYNYYLEAQCETAADEDCHKRRLDCLDQQSDNSLNTILLLFAGLAALAAAAAILAGFCFCSLIVCSWLLPDPDTEAPTEGGCGCGRRLPSHNFPGQQTPCGDGPLFKCGSGGLLCETCKPEQSPDVPDLNGPRPAGLGVCDAPAEQAAAAPETGQHPSPASASLPGTVIGNVEPSNSIT